MRQDQFWTSALAGVCGIVITACATQLYSERGKRSACCHTSDCVVLQSAFRPAESADFMGKRGPLNPSQADSSRFSPESREWYTPDYQGPSRPLRVVPTATHRTRAVVDEPAFDAPGLEWPEPISERGHSVEAKEVDRLSHEVNELRSAMRQLTAAPHSERSRQRALVPEPRWAEESADPIEDIEDISVDDYAQSEVSPRLSLDRSNRRESLGERSQPQFTPTDEPPSAYPPIEMRIQPSQRRSRTDQDSGRDEPASRDIPW